MSDKREQFRNQWKKENTVVLSLRLSKHKDKKVLDAFESHRPLVSYVRELVKTDMDTDRKWQICMGVAIGAWYADKFGWRELKTQLCTLAEELGKEIGLDSAEVHRQAHQVMERERL